jgi:SSS family solute:Na+ symporter
VADLPSDKKSEYCPLKKENHMVFSIVLLVVFLSAMVVIGVWGMRKTATLSDFFLGGRSVGPWVSAFAYGTAYFSAVLFIGFGGKIGWGYGLDGLMIAGGNALIGTLAAWLILGGRTRRMTQNLDAMTMPEFIHERFEGRHIKMFAATIIFVFLIPYAASVFKGLGFLFEANFHIPYNLALFIMIGITGIYLILGGYFAVTLADFVQGIIMIFGAIIMMAVLTGKANEIMGTHGMAGGFTAASQAYAKWHASLPPPKASTFSLFNGLITLPTKPPALILLIGLVTFTSLGTWGMPKMTQKFYAIKDEKFIVKAAIATTIFAFIISFAAYYTGSLTHIFFDNASVPKMLDPTKGPNFDAIIPVLLTKFLPPALMGVILLLILSASMSTLSALVMVSASSIAIDLYKGHVNPNISKENSLAMMRFLCGVFVAFSFVIAYFNQSTIIVTLMALSWGAVSGSLTAPFFYGLFWKRATKAGVWAGMLTGLTIAVLPLPLMGIPLYQNYSPIIASIAMIVPFIVVPLLSIFTQPPSKGTLDKAFTGIGKTAKAQRVAAPVA